jgi:dihydrodipicolinate synthase/N-acetylneuraminate lyase
MLELHPDPIQMLRPRRRITGMSAVLLPFTDGRQIDWPAFRAHVARTAEAGLVPAVNMDTGHVNLLDEDTRRRVLEESRTILSSRSFVAGAFVADAPGTKFNGDAYHREMEAIQTRGAMPVIFPSYGLTGHAEEDILASYQELASYCDRFLAFELGTMFAPFGKIYSLNTFRGLLDIPQCVGVKHSSLRREPEWQRLALRDAIRPEFQILTGNDLAIDMVMYGSDYLLGLSTLAPDLFARRDDLWAKGDSAFYELNDALQYLGCFAFRAPVAAYKHSAAMFLKLRGWIDSDAAHPDSVSRPATDREVFREIGRHLGLTM